MFNPTYPINTSVNPNAYASGATVIDLSANPHDYRPAVDAVLSLMVRDIKDGKKPFVMAGEEHAHTAHVGFARLLSDGIKKHPFLSQHQKPVITIEQEHNLLESFVSDFGYLRGHCLKTSSVMDVLGDIKTSNPILYNRIQAMTVASWDWPYSPVSRLENSLHWQNGGYDVRLVDLGRDWRNNCLDWGDDVTKDFINDKTAYPKIYAADQEGMRLRNLFMVQECIRAMINAQMGILQTGYAHLGGREDLHPYTESLHNLSDEFEKQGIAPIMVLPHIAWSNLSNQALSAMNNDRTIIIRGGCDNAHHQCNKGSFSSEIASLSRIFKQSAGLGGRPSITSQEQYYHMQRAITDEVIAALREAGEKDTFLRRVRNGVQAVLGF